MPGEATSVFVLQTLKEEWRTYKDLKYGERRELELLEQELPQIEAFLNDSAKKSEKSQHFMVMEKQIRELVYDVEDTIEMCLTKKKMKAGAKAKTVGRFLNKFSFSTSMAKEVKSLREERVRKIVDLINRDFGKKDMPTTSLELSHTEVKLNQSIGQPSITITEDSSTGIQDQSSVQDKEVEFEDQETIIRSLMEQKEELEVVSITGMPGIGKTTLARKIFNDTRICHKFSLCIWIRASQKFNGRDTFLEILKKLVPDQSKSRPSDEELITTIRRCLANKEFFLVIDDLWAIKDWEMILRILPEENKMGRVVVTSRDKKVAVQVNLNRVPHKLSLLKDEKSLELLKLKVFGNRESLAPELEDVGKDIAKKCGGLPLTIVVIGGYLKSQFTGEIGHVGLRDIWKKVFENLNEILKQDEDNSISDVLELSCNTFPADMRLCFLYSGLFPQNHEISASRLTQLWIAEGFIRPKEKCTIEETAEKILDDLINMNFLIGMKKNLDQVKTCRVHDTIREFCNAKAMEENLFSVIRESKDGVMELERSRRLCLHSSLSEFLSAEPNGPRVRSFLSIFEEPLVLDQKQISTIPDAFEKLRVLNCSSIKFGQFPKVEKMLLLKHITLYIDNLDALPAQIYQLLNLRTLVVDTNSRSIEVKAKIWKMSQLRRLKTNAAFFLDDKSWKGKTSENIQAITRLSPDSCKETLSKRAPYLKTLGIRGKVDNLFNTFSLKNFSHLKRLKLVNELLLHEKKITPVILQLNCFPKTLQSLSLSNTLLTWNDHMPILATINSLKVLKLKDNAFTGVTWNAVGHSFVNLQSLHIDKTELLIWKAEATYFLRLTCLVLMNCVSLREIPEGIQKHLEKLEIANVSKSTADSARRIESIKKEAEQQNQISAYVVPFKLTIGEGCD